MTQQTSVLFVIPPGWPELVAHHEATSGMGALTPGPKPFLYPPHTVATCAAVTRAAGIKTAVLDLVGARLSLPDALSQIAADRSDVLGVLVGQGTALADAHFLRVLRQTCPERKVLLFGPSAHFVAQPWLDAGLADAALLGEPEGAIAQAVARVADENPTERHSERSVAESTLAPHASAGESVGESALRLRPAPLRMLTPGDDSPPGAISGTAAGMNAAELSGIIAAEMLRPDAYDADGLLTDLDALPFPAWDLVPWQAYGAVSLLSSRGCPAGCAYCAYTTAQGHRFRAQSPERTVAELAWLAKTFQPPRIQVRDPVFAHDRARVAAICEGVLAKGLKLNFACESRPEHFDDELLRLLKAAGCTTVKIGLESGDPVLLQRLNRVPDAASAERTILETQRAARTCHTLGITCQVFVLAGLPGQDAASLARTAAVLRRLPKETRVRAKAYQSHPGVALDAPTAIVPAETLAWLERANQPRPALWQRAYHQLKHLTSGQGSRSSPAPPPPRPPVTLPSRSPAPLLPSSLAGQRAFLTGGNGFVGGHVARALVAAGGQVVALVRPASPLGALADLPVEIVRGDLREPAEWADALRGCDLCFHVAALYGRADQAAAMYAVNADGTDVLLAACAAAGVRRVVHTSTVGTVGRPADPRTLPDETTPFDLWDRASHYVRSKYLGELIARSWGGTGLEVVIVKPTAPVGPGDGRPSATGKRILAALNGQVSPYPPGGINHVPVKDVALGILLAAERGVPGRTYILGHRDGNLDQAAFLRLVAEAAGTKPLKPATRSVSRGRLPVALTVDPTRAIRELGLPQSDLRAAFAEAVAWYRDQIV